MGCGASLPDGSNQRSTSPRESMDEEAFKETSLGEKKRDSVAGFSDQATPEENIPQQSTGPDKWAGPACVGNLGGPTPVRACSASEDGRSVAAIMHDGRPVVISDATPDERAQSFIIGGLDYLADQAALCCTVSLCGLYMGFYTWNPKARMAPRKLTLLTSTGKGMGWSAPLRRESCGLHSWTDCCFANYPEGKFFLAGASDGKLMLVNVAGKEKDDVRWRPMWKAEHPGAELTCVACHAIAEPSIPGSTASILLGFSDGIIESWLSSPDPEHGEPKLLRRLEGCTSPIRSLTLNKEENLAVSISDDGIVRVWDHLGPGDICGFIQTSQGAVLSATLVAPNVLVTCQTHSPVITVWHLDMKQAVLLLGWPANANRPSGNAANSNVWSFAADTKAQCSMLASAIACKHEASMYIWQLSQDVTKAVNELVPPLDKDMQVIPSADRGLPALLDGFTPSGSGLKLTLKPLLIAASSGRAEAVQLLLNQGENPEVGIDPMGNGSLHLAAHYQRWAAFSLLARACKGKSEFLAKTNKAGMTLLHIAAAREIPDSVFYDLVHAGFPLHVIDIKDKAGKTALQYAAEANDMHAVMLLGRMGGDLFGFDFPAGGLSAHKEAMSLVHQLSQARLARNCELFFALINNEANLLAAYVPDEDGDSQLHHCARKDDLGLLQPLLEMGSSAGIELDVRNRPAMATPLHISVECGQLETCCLLLSHGCDVDAVQQGGITALHLAVSGRRIDIIEAIMKSGANIDLQADDGLTPLAWAVQAGYLSMSRLLLDKYSADPNLHSPVNGSAIMSAVKEGNLSLCKLLVKNGALPVGAGTQDVSSQRELLIHAALSHGNSDDTADLLRSAVATIEDLDAKDADGHPAVTLARAKGGQKLCTVLLELGADPNGCDPLGNTPLHSAACHGDSAAIRTLRDYGAELDPVNEAGVTPLFESLMSKDPPAYAAAEALLKLGANVSLVYGENKDTLLHLAASSGDERAVNILLSEGASPSQRNGEGKSPTDVAAKTIVAELLKSVPEPKVGAVDTSGELHMAAKAENRARQMKERTLRIMELLAAQDARRKSETPPDSPDDLADARVHPMPNGEEENSAREPGEDPASRP